MSTQEGLIQAIHDDPDNDCLRLIHADFLEDLGSPEDVARARFIRTQVERARLAADDERHSSLMADELRLVAAHGNAWRRGHVGFRTCRFRRGFIEYVKLNAKHFLHHRRELFRLEPVRDVCLTGLRGGAGLQLARCPEWAQVQSLRIFGLHREPAAEDILALLASPHLTRLEHLTLRPAQPFEGPFLHALVRLPSLRNLRSFALDPIRMDGEAAAIVAGSPWPRLRSLWIADVRGWSQGLAGDAVAALWDSPHWGRLEALGLSLVNPEPAALAGLGRALGQNPFLRRLSLAVVRERVSRPFPGTTGRLHGVGSSSGAALLEHLAAWPPLQELNFSSVNLQGSAMEQLAGWPPFGGLKRLRLRHCELGPPESQLLAHSSFPRLAHLDLSDNPHLDAVALLGPLDAPVLGSLVLKESAHTSVLAGLARWPGLARLRQLSLAYFHGSLDLESLVASSDLRSLVWLEVDQGAGSARFRGPLQRATTEALANLPHLAFLELRYYDFPDGAAQVLHDAPGLAWLRTEWGRRSPLPLEETVAQYHGNEC